MTLNFDQTRDRSSVAFSNCVNCKNNLQYLMKLIFPIQAHVQAATAATIDSPLKSKEKLLTNRNIHIFIETYSYITG
jgi:hypothetical protein